LGGKIKLFYIHRRNSSMAVNKDWLPAGRDGILAMAMDWITVCTPKQSDWNIPVTALTELANLRGFARNALETAKNETTRTPVAKLHNKGVTRECGERTNALWRLSHNFVGGT
jgi:hypothetical protein